MKKLLSLALVAFVAVLAGCGEKTPAEKIDAAAKDAKTAAGDAAGAASDASKAAADAAKEALKTK